MKTHLLVRCTLAAVVAVPLAAATNDDPQYQSKGLNKREYFLKEAGLKLPYSVFVPSTWAPGKHLPMVVVLHGGGSHHNTPFERGDGILAKEAEKNGFIIVSPEGGTGAYPGNGFGSDYAPVPANPSAAPPPTPKLSPEELAKQRQISEADTLAVIDRTKAEYGTEKARTYLMGNSMGMLGALYLAQKYPERWCAIGPSDGPTVPSSYPYERIKKLTGAMFVHGDNDTIALLDATREIADNFKKAGVDTRFLVVKGGTHNDSWAMALGETFDFYNQHRCGK